MSYQYSCLVLYSTLLSYFSRMPVRLTVKIKMIVCNFSENLQLQICTPQILDLPMLDMLEGWYSQIGVSRPFGVGMCRWENKNSPILLPNFDSCVYRLSKNSFITRLMKMGPISTAYPQYLMSAAFRKRTLLSVKSLDSLFYLHTRSTMYSRISCKCQAPISHIFIGNRIDINW